jgi:Flp pilus assembly protein TadD
MQPRLAEALAAFHQGQLDRARELAGAELEQQPGSAPLQHLRGLIDCRAGQMESGVEWLRRASEAEPGNAAFRAMLVRALVDAGRPTDALAAATRPGGTSPADQLLWHARAEAASAAEDHEAAAEAWQLIASANPGDWRAWGNAGNALAALRRWGEAADALARAARLNPGEEPIRRNLASALAEAGRNAEAAAALEPLVASAPTDAPLRLLYAQVLTDLARHDDSLAQFDEAVRLAAGDDAPGGGLIALAIKPGETAPDPESAGKVAFLLERTNRMDALRDFLEEAEARGIAREQLGYASAAVALRDKNPAEAKRLLLCDEPGDHPARWHRLMAKIADALGDAEGAFESAEAMNRATDDYDSRRERGAAYRQRVRALAETMTPDWAARLSPAGPGERRSPAFLVGFPRSGTTLLDTFLMGHPNAEVLEEVHMLGAAEKVLGDLAVLPQRSKQELESARRAYFEELDRHVDPGFLGLVVDKLPLNMLGLPFIHALFPDARIIFAQRHPVDAVLSGFMQNFVLNDAMASFLDIADAADLYDAAMLAFTAGRDAVPLEVHTLVYEQLVASPEATLRPLVEFLGLEWHSELLDHQATARSRGAILTPSYDQVIEPLSSAPSGRWRRYEKQLAPVLPVLLPWAQRLGYTD